MPFKKNHSRLTKRFSLLSDKEHVHHHKSKLRAKKKHAPFWQANMPYLHETAITFYGFRWLGYIMAFLGGAINAGGFFAVIRYTSHMSGELAQIADNIYIGQWKLVVISFLMVFSFFLGATHSSMTIIWAKRRRFRSSYGLSMWVEALYMMLFGLMGAGLNQYNILVSPTAMLMCFIMGMHNTVMTILSNGMVRTTHMTGFITDIGIEFSKVLFAKRKSKDPHVPEIQVNIPKIKLYSGVILCFVLGGITGAWGFHQLGFGFVFPVALVLLILGSGSVGYDVKLRLRMWLYKRHTHH